MWERSVGSETRVGAPVIIRIVTDWNIWIPYAAGPRIGINNEYSYRIIFRIDIKFRCVCLRKATLLPESRRSRLFSMRGAQAKWPGPRHLALGETGIINTTGWTFRLGWQLLVISLRIKIKNENRGQSIVPNCSSSHFWNYFFSRTMLGLVFRNSTKYVIDIFSWRFSRLFSIKRIDRWWCRFVSFDQYRFRVL